MDEIYFPMYFRNDNDNGIQYYIIDFNSEHDLMYGPPKLRNRKYVLTLTSLSNGQKKQMGFDDLVELKNIMDQLHYK